MQTGQPWHQANIQRFPAVDCRDQSFSDGSGTNQTRNISSFTRLRDFTDENGEILVESASKIQLSH